MPDFVVGNTWSGVPMYRLRTPPTGAGNLASVEIQFRPSSTKSPAYAAKLSSDDPTKVGIISAADWSFTIYEQTLPLQDGEFHQSVKMTDDSVPPKSYTRTMGTIKGTLPPTR